MDPGKPLAAANRQASRGSPAGFAEPVSSRRCCLILDGALVPTRSKNYRYSTNHQVVIDTDSRLAVSGGRHVPGNRNECKAWELSGASWWWAAALIGMPIVLFVGWSIAGSAGN